MTSVTEGIAYEIKTLLEIFEARDQLADKVYWALIDAPAVQEIRVAPTHVAPWATYADVVHVSLAPHHWWSIPLVQVFQGTDEEVQDGYHRVMAKIGARG